MNTKLSVLTALFLAPLIVSAACESSAAQPVAPAAELEAGVPVLNVAFSPDGKFLACLGTELGRRAPNLLGIQPGISVFDVATRKTVFAVRPGGNGGGIRGYTGEGGRHQLAFAPDGKFLAWAGSNNDHLVYLWNAGKREQISIGALNGGRDASSAVAFSPDGKTVLSAKAGGQVIVWDVASGQNLRAMTTGLQAISGLAVAPAGDVVACADRQETIVLLDANTGEVRRRLTHKGSAYPCLTFSSDGRLLMTTRSGAARVWDILTGQMLLEIADGITAVALSPDDSTAALGTREGNILLWDLAQNAKVAELTNDRSVQTLAFAPDGRTLASAGAAKASGKILLWDVSRLPTRTPAAGKLGSADLDKLWLDLGDHNGFKAAWALARGMPEQTIPFLRAQLKPAVPLLAADQQRIDRLIAELDDNTFSVREKASAELRKVGRTALQALRKKLANAPSLETGRRLTKFVEQLEEAPSADELRGLRAVLVLERVGTADARKLLEALSAGFAEAALTQEAKASLQRLAR